MAVQKSEVVEATNEFDMLPRPPKDRVVSMVNIGSALMVLTAQGRIYERVGDSSKASQPFGPHWAWREVEGPRV